MSEQRSGEQQRKAAAAKVWLSYYNRMLFERGAVTERERSRMALKIDKRTAPHCGAVLFCQKR